MVRSVTDMGEVAPVYEGIVVFIGQHRALRQIQLLPVKESGWVVLWVT